MASRILHRLRHALTGEGEQEGLPDCGSEVEEFPESSELEDDTEGLSTRLSGTLSFTSNYEDDETEEEAAPDGTRQDLDPEMLGDVSEAGEHSSPLAERQGSNMLTRQLQELWRKSRGSLVPQRLLFEVTSTNVVNERSSKYVVSEAGGPGWGEALSSRGAQTGESQEAEGEEGRWFGSPPSSVRCSGEELGNLPRWGRAAAWRGEMGLPGLRPHLPPARQPLVSLWGLLPYREGSLVGSGPDSCLLPSCCNWGTAGLEEPQLYTIYLIRAGQFDKAPATIARRYSDFERLNRHLRRRFGSDMAGVSFPRKRLRRNFTAETIAKRSRAFEQFLSHLHSLPEIRRSTEFLEFFFLNDLQAAQRSTCTGTYCEALAAWTNAHRLQDKLGACRSGRFLLTLAGLAICHQELGQLAEAHAYSEQALQLLEAQDTHPLLAPFLQAHIHLAWMLGKDKRQAEARLQGLQDTGLAGPQPPTLKELLIKQPLP